MSHLVFISQHAPASIPQNKTKLIVKTKLKCVTERHQTVIVKNVPCNEIMLINYAN